MKRRGERKECGRQVGGKEGRKGMTQERKTKSSRKKGMKKMKGKKMGRKEDGKKVNEMEKECRGGHTEGKTLGRNKSRLEKREGIQRTGKKEE